VTEENIRFKPQSHHQHQQVVPEQPEYLSGPGMPVAAKGFVTESFGFKQMNYKLSFAAGEKELMSILLHVSGKVLEKVNMPGMANVDEYTHGKRLIG